MLERWSLTHDGAGAPEVVRRGFGCEADHEVRLSSYTHKASPAVHGNGIHTFNLNGADALEFIPGEEYSIELTLRFEQGLSMDHFFAVIAPGPWRPECGNPSDRETFYPPAYTRVIANWKGVKESGLAPVQTLRSTFIWEPLDAEALAEPDSVAPNQFVEVFDPTWIDGGWLHLYPKQYLDSDSLQVSIDDVHIVHRPARDCDSLWVRYNLFQPEPDTTRPQTCEQQLAIDLLSRIEDQRNRILEHRMDEVEAAYRTVCPLDDDLTLAHPLNHYHYTLYYHDAAGRLVRTVPPEGVDVDDAHTRASTPDHTHVTEYAHNGLGNLLRKDTPDGGVVTTWYDRLERPRFTQTAQDVIDGQYRYICYDSRSRPVRSGVDILDSDDPLALHVDDVDWPVDDPASDADCTGCTERIFSFYGTPVAPFSDQLHLSDRLSCVANDRGDTIAYRYDSQGNISAIHQHIEGLGSTLLEYEFDAATGMVLETVYNRGRADEFHLRNDYDEDQRIVASYSSRDGRIWHRDATTEYYCRSGAVKRRELGHYGVQGVDFTYNLHGTLIGVNAPGLGAAEDPGHDGATGGLHQWLSPDVFGMHLAQYRGEFGRAGSPFRTENAAHTAAQDQFNGITASIAFQQRHDFGDALDQIGHQYRYDEDARLRSSTFRSWGGGAWLEDATQHSGTFDYDANGNLTALTRHGASGTGSIDNLTYHHVAGKNQLNHVADASGNVTGLDLAGQAPDNFSYDADGRMTGDMAEGIQAIAWRADGKVEEVTKADTVISFRYNPLGQRIAKVVVPSAGDTTTTWYIPDQSGQIMALYRSEGTDGPVLSFNRNAVGTVSRVDSLAPHFDSLLAATPFHTRHLGDRRIELKDHLGNIRSVVSDLEVAQDTDGDGAIDGLQAQILSAKDYHAFGSILEGRTHDSIPHRFGFNGKEIDPELKGQGNSYDFHARFYDPRLGVWLSVDPLADKPGQIGKSPYSAFANNPIIFVDPDGKAANLAVQCGVGVAFGAAIGGFTSWYADGGTREIVRATLAGAAGGCVTGMTFGLGTGAGGLAAGSGNALTRVLSTRVGSAVAGPLAEGGTEALFDGVTGQELDGLQTAATFLERVAMGQVVGRFTGRMTRRIQEKLRIADRAIDLRSSLNAAGSAGNGLRFSARNGGRYFINGSDVTERVDASMRRLLDAARSRGPQGRSLSARQARNRLMRRAFRQELDRRIVESNSWLRGIFQNVAAGPLISGGLNSLYSGPEPRSAWDMRLDVTLPPLSGQDPADAGASQSLGGTNARTRPSPAPSAGRRRSVDVGGSNEMREPD